MEGRMMTSKLLILTALMLLDYREEESRPGQHE
jgi:hypothetical protein